MYRKEIDGLRALAVLPVIFFHADIPGFSGGYIGVDIFFVISGYLITSIIISERSRNQFSIINFYERRARRILPALSLVLFCTTVAAFLLMPADFLTLYSQSLVSVSTFSSNIYFYLTSGYFSVASDEKPLLHTWSLAVEEQYYILFPIFITLFWRLGKEKIFFSIVFLSFLSLFWAEYMSEIEGGNANFYLLFSRAWELLFGSIIAFIKLDKLCIQKWLGEILGLVGLILIIFSIVFFDDSTPFPSFYTLMPVLGAVLIIMFSRKGTMVGEGLSNKIFVSIGLISYSLYLWHQPLFSFLRLKSIGEPETMVFVFAIFIVFLLSFLSYKFIEKPFRNKSSFNRVAIFRYSILSIILFLVVGLSGYMFNGFDSRFEADLYSESIEFSPKRVECHTRGTDYLNPESACQYFGDEVSWASFGDSHTVELAYALAQRLKEKDEGLLHLSFSSCSPPALQFDVKVPGCSEWINKALVHLESSSSIKSVLVGFRYSEFLFGDQRDLYPELPFDSPRQRFSIHHQSLVEGRERELYWDSLLSIITRLINSGKNVYVVYPIPELPIHIRKALRPFSVFGEKTILDIKKSTTETYYYKRHGFILKKLDSIIFDDNFHAIKPFNILCKDGFCPAVIDGEALYFDDNHLSVAGARKLISNIISIH